MVAAPEEEQRADVADVLLAAALTVFAQLDLRFNLDNSTQYGSQFAAASATAIATGMLALRRRTPLLTAGVVALAVGAPELAHPLTITLWGDFVPMLVAMYSVARHRELRRAAVGALALVAATIVAMIRVPVIGTASNIPFSFVPFVAAFVAGMVLRRREHAHAAATERALRLESERDERVRVAVAEERERIARELHDIVAHSVSVMVVQAGAAEDLLDRAPDRARQPLRAVQDTGQQAIGELRRMLGLLRGGGPLTLRPQPGTADLPALVDQVGDAGLPVALEVTGTPQPLPAGVELAVHRIVQEALTNVLKHAGPARAWVTLAYGDGAVEVCVRDDGRGRAPGRTRGHGLIGMRERVAVYGGSLAVGDQAGGGFAVRATIPVEGGR
jgi:signal transduction histidine kinase